jgi:hypothetical protein
MLDTLHRSALLRAGFGRRRGLSAEFSTGIHKAVKCLLGIEYKYALKFLDSEAQPSLGLEHLHESFVFGLVNDGDALALAGTGKEDLYSRIAEHRVAVTVLNGSPRGGRRLAQTRERILRHLPDFRSFLLLVFLVVESEGVHCKYTKHGTDGTCCWARAAHVK